MDKHGIEKAVALAIENPEETYLYYTTEQLLRGLSESGKFLDRIIPSCNIDPRRGHNNGTFDCGSLVEEYVERGCKIFGEVLANLSADNQRMQQM